MKKIILYFVTVACFLCLQQKVDAQTKVCDLEINVHSPENDSVYEHGDTAYITFQIINHGPDDIVPSDTIFFYYSNYMYMTYCPSPDIPNGDSEVFNYYMYTWADSLSEPDTMTTCAYLANVSTTYNDTNSSNDTADCVTYIIRWQAPNGISNLSRKLAQDDLILYPNPAISEITLQIHLNKEPIPVTISIKDILGRRLWQKDYGMLSGNQKIILNVAPFNPGLYILELDEGDTKLFKKMVLQ